MTSSAESAVCAQNLSLRVRISAKTAAGFAPAMPTLFISAGSSARRNGFVAFSCAIVVGSVGLSAARSFSTSADALLQRRVVRIDGHARTCAFASVYSWPQ